MRSAFKIRNGQFSDCMSLYLPFLQSFLWSSLNWHLYLYSSILLSDPGGNQRQRHAQLSGAIPTNQSLNIAYIWLGKIWERKWLWRKTEDLIYIIKITAHFEIKLFSLWGCRLSCWAAVQRVESLFFVRLSLPSSSRNRSYFPGIFAPMVADLSFSLSLSLESK